MNPFEVVVVIFVMAMIVVELGLIFFAVRSMIQQFREDRETDQEGSERDQDQ